MTGSDRPFITLPADQPDYETLTELTMEQKAALPARFHTPVFSDAQPPLFLCRVCWDGETSQITTWPCASALKAGWDVFGPDREAGRG